MAFGVTATGFVRKLASDIVDSLSLSLRERISKNLKTRDPKTFIGNFVNISADELSQVWELGEAAYYQFDPLNADEYGLEALGRLTGTPRRGADVGRVTITAGLQAGFSAAANAMVVNVLGQPNNRWHNVSAVSSVPSTGDYEIEFESVAAGSEYTAAANTLTVIADGGLTGWSSARNAIDAEPGRDIEDLDEFRIRRDLGLAVQGSGSAPAIVSDLIQVDGVLQVRVFENRTAYDKNGIPAYGLRIVVWSGNPSAATDEVVATQIFNSINNPTPLTGAQSYNVTDDNGQILTMQWDEPTETALYVNVVVTATGATTTEIQDAILAQHSETIGKAVNYERLRCSLYTVPEVEDIQTFTINGGTVDLAAVADGIYTLDRSNITVNING